MSAVEGVLVSIVDYGVCNLGSIANMLRKIGFNTEFIATPTDIERADRIILPGVGAYDHGVSALSERGLFGALKEKAVHGNSKLLGICLGMQLLCEGSEEGRLPGLGLIRGTCKRFSFAEGSPFRVPHMGWNEIAVNQQSPLMDGLDAGARFYFTHSYHMVCQSPEDVLATANHGLVFTAAIQKGNIAGVQFHPEKSHRFGMTLLQNFGSWRA